MAGRRLVAAWVGALLTFPVAVSQAQDPPALPVTVSVSELTAALVGDVPLRITASVTNNGTRSLRRVRVRVLLGAPLRSRSALQAVRTESFGTTRAEERVGDGELGPSGQSDLRIEIPASELGLDRADPHVYPLRIEVRAAGRGRVGLVDTFLPWWPAAPQTRMPLSWVWPMVEPSHQLIGREFTDDALAESLRDGRLATLLRVGAQAGPASRITWAVDPALIDEVGAMASPDGYVVGGEPGVGSSAATTWLGAVRTALTGARVIALPYGDTDIDTLLRRGLRSEVLEAVQLGRNTINALDGVDAETRIAWPPESRLGSAGRALLSGSGVTGVVLGGSALPASEGVNYTPTAPYPLSPDSPSGLRALVADETLSALLDGGPGVVGIRLGVQRVLAETAMIALERPSDPRAIVIAPPRSPRWDPETDYATGLLELTATAPWLEPTALTDLLDDDTDVTERTEAPDPPLEGLSEDLVTASIDARRRLQRYVAILTRPETDTPPIANALLRAGSSAWRHDEDRGRDLVRAAARAVDALLGRLRVATGGLVTMTSRTGNIPITIVNDIGQPVRVRIEVIAGQRLTVLSRGIGQPELVPEGRFLKVVRGRAVTAGVFPIRVRLLTPSDRSLIGPEVTLRIRSTAYGLVALVFTGGAFALLLIGSATRIVQRRRRARAAA